MHCIGTRYTLFLLNSAPHIIVKVVHHRTCYKKFTFVCKRLKVIRDGWVVGRGVKNSGKFNKKKILREKNLID